MPNKKKIPPNSKTGNQTMDNPLSSEALRGKEFLAGQDLSSINPDTRTVDCIFFTGIDIPRTDWWTGQKYVLRFDAKGGDFSLLNNGAPILDNHSSWGGSSDQKGRVERAWQEGSNSKATLRFSRRPEVDGLWQDIQDKIVTKFSMGVEILNEEKIQENNQEIRLAKKWRPFELSVAPIPADFGTTTLSAEDRGINNHQMGTSPEGESMPDKVETPGSGAQETLTPTAQSVIEQQLKTAQEAGAAAERARVRQILETCKALKIGDEFGQKHITLGTSIEAFRPLAIDEQVRQADKWASAGQGHTRMIRDEVVTRRELMEAALFGLMNPKVVKEDRDNQFIGLTLKQVAEESVRLQMGLHSIPPIATVVKLAMQTTSDFASALENTARKQLLNQYELANPTYKIWTKRSVTPDFKNMTRVRLSETPALVEVPEGAQITIGMMSDKKETYALATYGRGVSFTRQMLINDDLGAFNDIIGQFGQQAARMENKTVYAILTTNGNLADGVALFADARGNHGTGALGNTGFDSMFTAMGTVKGMDGVSILNIVPRYVIVPKAKEATAKANLLATGPNLVATSQNWFAGRLEPVADGELDATSTAVWYGAADPAIMPGIEYCFLQGAEGPQFIRQENQNGILGIQFYCYEDFAATAVDWRPLYYSSGS